MICLLNFLLCPRTTTHFFFGSFGGKMYVLELKRELGIFIEVFRMIKCTETLLLVFCKAVYVKAQQMDLKPV